MLVLPPSGFQLSTNRHNVDRDVLLDWIEGSVVFSSDRVSKTDFVDILTEECVYHDQDFALELLNDAWIELERRIRCHGGQAPYAVDRDTVVRSASWTEHPCHSFCLLTSLQIRYAYWARQLKPKYNKQGELFERIVDESLEAAGWSTFRTGWSASTSGLGKIGNVVQAVADHLGERTVTDGVRRWAGAQANEAGLDVVCSEPYPDKWGGRPLYLFQCASGANWADKLKSPDLDLWGKIVEFSNPPQRGFATTLAFHHDTFLWACARVCGVVLDRTRVAAREPSWCSSSLRSDLNRFVRPSVKKMATITCA